MKEDSVRVWIPYWRGGLHTSLAVPFSGVQMTRAIYRELLQDRIDRLIQMDTAAARRLFDTMGQGAFSEVCTASEPEAWSVQVMLCHSTHIVLNEIAYEHGEVQMRPREDFNNLHEVLAQLAHFEWE